MLSRDVVVDALIEALQPYRGPESQYSEGDLEFLVDSHIKYLGGLLNDSQYKRAFAEAIVCCRWFPKIADLMDAHKRVRGKVRRYESGSDVCVKGEIPVKLFADEARELAKTQLQENN